ncbi:CHAT domain-containing tetratricopeptide repeat protein [Nodosilinea sp. E11]|uniref:CHAT domain-containing protein n=1 Tax=Nodosilinea sp. E11 TaxID=3037479 RepID=UPI002934FFF9|nr:CHAT domain-containing tetratricopeptide repeat protein [Nodosilinea sp. E11]WOD39902.1 CHAT domain-containing tetratricopeptide repeat protein [Nodosilinea sp. E11]
METPPGTYEGFSQDNQKDIEEKIALCQKALEEINRQEDPTLWSAYQADLGDNLLMNFKGDRAQHIEDAIVTYQSALQEISLEGSPAMWLGVMYALAIAYSMRIKGEQINNGSVAMSTYQRAVRARVEKDIIPFWPESVIAFAAYSARFFTQVSELQNWQGEQEARATCQTDLGYCLFVSPEENRAQNIEDAIKVYHQALPEINREANPKIWAESMVSLANAYFARIKGDRAHNIGIAIDVIEQVLQVNGFDTLSTHWLENRFLWAAMLADLSDSLLTSHQPISASSFDTAINAYQKALSVFTVKERPKEWALLKLNLAKAYFRSEHGDPSQNIKKAIVACEEAQKIRIRETMPTEWQEDKMFWADCQAKLGGILTIKTQGDRAKNIEDGIEAYQKSLQVRTHDSLPAEWAKSMYRLATTYKKRICGDQLENIKIALSICEQILQVMSQDTLLSSQDKETWVSIVKIFWVDSQEALGERLLNTSQGNREQNIEDAIFAFRQCLQGTSREKKPLEWATAMKELSDAYLARISGDQAQNVEVALDAITQCLEVRSQEDDPLEWVAAMNTLASAYLMRIRGDQAQNLELAIETFETCLRVITEVQEKGVIYGTNDAYGFFVWAAEDHEERSFGWASIMHNLGNAYFRRIHGDRAQNTERAIIALEQSLQIRTQEKRPLDWALSTVSLANAYVFRILGDHAQNIEKALDAYEQALKVITKDTRPIDWAALKHDIGHALSRRVYGERAQNIEDAIESYEQALQVIMQEKRQKKRQIDWAKTIDNIGNAYFQRVNDDRAQNIEKAIAFHKQALQAWQKETPNDFNWALSKINLGIAYTHRIQGERAQNIEDATIAYSQALEVFTPNTYPNHCRRAADLFADLSASQSNWPRAQVAYRIALDANEVLYQSSIFKGSQNIELFVSRDLYRRAAYAYAKTDDFKAAITTLEQGRARNLREALQQDSFKLKAVSQINPQLLEQYQRASNTLRQLEFTEHNYGFNINQLRTSLESLKFQAATTHQALQDCLKEIRQNPGYESFLTLPTFEDIAATIQSTQPLVYLLHTSNGSIALILTIDGITGLWLNSLTDEKLVDLLDNIWFKAYKQVQSNRQGWLQILDQVTQCLWDWVMAPVVNHLQQHQFQSATLIPTGYLSFLPLHAAWTEDSSSPTGRRYAFEAIQFTYSPNALSLSAARAVAEQTPANKLLAINEPLPVNASYLPSSSFETAKAVSTFPGKGNFKILQNEAATPAAVLDALPNYSTVHLSCHGSANFQTPLDSGLLMANDEVLSLRDLLDLKLKGLRLAILSACETGIPGTELPDEVISLPTGLLQAGAAGVISSLWSVSDLSTMLLLSRFYDLWRPQNPDATPLELPEALRQAQIWLRDSTGPDLTPYLQNSHPELAAKLEQAKDQRPFAHPFYWAAFTYIGV